MVSLTITALSSVLALLSMTAADIINGVRLWTVEGASLTFDDGTTYPPNWDNEIFSIEGDLKWTLHPQGAQCYVDHSRGWPKDALVPFTMTGDPTNFLSPCGWQGEGDNAVRVVCEHPQAACK